MSHLNLAVILAGCLKETSVVIGRLLALTITELAPSSDKTGGNYDFKRLPILLLWE